MKEGKRSRVMSVPWMTPNAAQKSTPARMASVQCQLVVSGWTSWTVIAAPQAPTKPTERSISPRTRANPSAIARTMKTALCWKRLTRLTGKRKTWFGLIAPNTSTIAAIATMTGRTPLSPATIRANHARKYSPRDCATSSGGTSACAASGAAVRSGACSGGRPETSAVPGRRATRARCSSCCHVLDDALPVEGRGLVLDDQAAQIEDSDPVGHLEDVVEVVRDDHHRQTSVAQAFDE